MVKHIFGLHLKYYPLKSEVHPDYHQNWEIFWAKRNQENEIKRTNKSIKSYMVKQPKGQIGEHIEGDYDFDKTKSSGNAPVYIWI